MWFLLKRFLKKIDKAIFSSISDYFIQVLETECIEGGNCKTLLDIGCGKNSPIHKFSKKMDYTIGVDAFEPAIEESRKLKIHNEYKVMECKDTDNAFQENSFDCVCALDLIEHLSKKDGLKLIDSMERIARKKVIIFTPNGFLFQGIHDNNPLQPHLSGWEVDEMKDKGYRVIGIGGLKLLKGEVARIKWRPEFFWRRISLLSQIIVTNRPNLAFAILCIKDLNKELNKA